MISRFSAPAVSAIYPMVQHASLLLFFWNPKVVALANVPLHPRTCLQSFHLWAAPRPTEHSPSVTLIRRLVRNKQERERPHSTCFHLVLPISVKQYLGLKIHHDMRMNFWRKKKKKDWERVNLPFFPIATSIIVWPACLLWSQARAVN